MLYAFREGDSNMRSVWLCSRNDAIGNVAVMIAAAGVFGTGSGWPDLIVALVMFAVFARYFRLYIQSVTTGAGIGLMDLVRMTLRKVNPTVITRSKIMAVQAGFYESEGITTKALEAHYLAGGNVPHVIRAIIAAHRADIDLDFDRAAAIDLAGRNILEAVQTSVYPRVIDCPPQSGKRMTLDAVAKNNDLLIKGDDNGFSGYEADSLIPFIAYLGVLAAIAEILPPAMSDRFPRDGTTRFPYTSPAGPAPRTMTWKSAGGVRVMGTTRRESTNPACSSRIGKNSASTGSPSVRASRGSPRTSRRTRPSPRRRGGRPRI